MYLALYVAIILGVAGLVLVVLSYWSERPHERRRRIVLGAAGIAGLLLAVSIMAALQFAQPTVCQALGGEWFQERDNVCRNEWGGNGNNAGFAPWPSF